MSGSVDFEQPDHFTAGAVGLPGQRVFYLQARESGTLLTLKCEKEHVRVLGEHLGRLLPSLPASGEAAPGAPALLEPVEPAWAVGALGVGYDETSRRIVIVANELVEEEGGGEPAAARFLVTTEQAAAFVEQARALMAAGRRICPMCQEPEDPGGHVCPRSNGHVLRRA